MTAFGVDLAAAAAAAALTRERAATAGMLQSDSSPTDSHPTMLTINKLIPQGRGLAPALVKRAARVELDWDVRQKSRFDATDSSGRALGVFLPRGTVVRGGDLLVAEDGSLISVLAAPQPVLVVRHCADHGTPFDLLRAAYHLGNRHVQLQLAPDCLMFEPDHVLAEMLQQMHLVVTEANQAFEPESGAYAASTADGPAHDHGQHEHAHAHAARHKHLPTTPAPALAAAIAPVHMHGPGCNHDHDHDHGHKH